MQKQQITLEQLSAFRSVDMIKLLKLKLGIRMGMKSDLSDSKWGMVADSI